MIEVKRKELETKIKQGFNVDWLWKQQEQAQDDLVPKLSQPQT